MNVASGIKGPKKVVFGYDNSFPTRSHQPHLSLAALTQYRSHLFDSSIELSTKRGYDTAYKHWTAFITIYGFSEVPSASTFGLFAAFVSRRVHHVDKILSAVAHRWKAVLPNWEEIRLQSQVATIVKGHRKLNVRAVKRSLPVLPSHLVLFVTHAFRQGASFDDLLAAFIAVVAFGGLLRLGECLLSPVKADRDARKVPRRSSVTSIAGECFTFVLPYHKADRFYSGSVVAILSANSTPAFNFVKLIDVYLSRRDSLHGTTGFLFLNEKGMIPNRDWFLGYVSRFAPAVTGHGFRAGGATYLAQRQVSDSAIRRMGRWSSDAWEIYVRTHPALLAATQISNLRQNLV